MIFGQELRIQVLLYRFFPQLRMDVSDENDILTISEDNHKICRLNSKDEIAVDVQDDILYLNGVNIYEKLCFMIFNRYHMDGYLNEEEINVLNDIAKTKRMTIIFSLNAYLKKYNEKVLPEEPERYLEGFDLRYHYKTSDEDLVHFSFSVLDKVVEYILDRKRKRIGKEISGTRRQDAASIEGIKKSTYKQRGRPKGRKDSKPRKKPKTEQERIAEVLNKAKPKKDGRRKSSKRKAKK